MKIINRKREVDETIPLSEYNDCQASINSDGRIVLRSFDRSDNSKDQIVVLSVAETGAIISLIGQIDKFNNRLPF